MSERKFITAIKAKDYDKALVILNELDESVELKRCPYNLIFQQYKESPEKEIIEFSEYLCSQNVYFDNQTLIDNLDLINVFNEVFKRHISKVIVKDLDQSVLDHIKPLYGAKFLKQRQAHYNLTDLMVLAGYSAKLAEFIKTSFKHGEIPEGLFSSNKQYNVFINLFFLDRKLSNEEIEAFTEILYYVYEPEERILFFSEVYISQCIKIVEQKILDTDDDSYRNRYQMIIDASFLDEDELEEIVDRVENTF